jgi:WD40 repeat protein
MILRIWNRKKRDKKSKIPLRWYFKILRNNYIEQKFYMKYLFLFFVLLISYWGKAQEPRLVLPIGHTSSTESSCFSSDDTKLLTSSLDKTVKLWDAKTGKLLLDFTGQYGMVLGAFFIQKDSKIIFWTYNKLIRVCDIRTGRILDYLKQFDGFIKVVKLTNDKSKIIIISENERNQKDELTILNANNFQPYFNRLETNSAIGDIYISSNNIKLALTTSKGIQIWDINTGKFNLELIGHKDKCTSVDFSPNCDKILTASWDKSVKVWDAKTGNLMHNLIGHNEEVYRACFNKDGYKVLSTSYKFTKLWDTKNGKLLYTIYDTISQHIKTPNAFFSPSSKQFIKTHYDTYSTNIYDVLTGKIIDSVPFVVSNQNCISYSNDGNKLLLSPYETVVWSLKSKTQLLNISSHVRALSSIYATEENDKIFIGSNDTTYEVWNTSKMVFNENTKEYRYFERRNNNSILFEMYLTTAGVWDIKLDTLLFTIQRNSYINSSSLKYSPDKKTILCGWEDGIITLYDALSGKLILTLSAHSKMIKNIEFSKDSKQIVSSSLDGTAKIWDLSTGKCLHELKGSTKGLYNVVYSNDNLKVATAGVDGKVLIWNALNGLLIHALDVSKEGVLFLNFDSLDNKLFTVSLDYKIKIWNANTGSLISENNDHTNEVKGAIIYKNKFLISVSEDKTAKLIDFNSGKTICDFFRIDTLDFIVKLMTGYYQSSPNAAKLLHYVTKDLKVITFEQLDVKYNRPDKVLEAIGSKDTLLINSYKKAYQKRIKKLGIDTSQFRDGYSVPESDFINRDAIEYEQTKDKLILKIKGNDSTYKLDRFNVWVNEVPLFGLRGIKTKQNNNFDTTISITLSQGENRIETSITNVNGTESYRMPLFVKYTPAIFKETKQHFIGIGINQFSNSEYNLSWSVKDIRDLAIKLKSKYPNIIIDTLFDSNVTKENILALKQKLLQLNEDDKVIVSYSGHGVLSKDFDYYLSTYSINFNKPEEKGLAYDDLESLLDNIKPRQKLMLIDACHSGEVDKDEIAKIEASKATLTTNGVTTKSTIKVVKKEKQLGMTNSFELMQSLFVNVGKGTGATIISAAGGMQYAQERGDLKNGVFTYSIIEAMNNNSTLKVSELKKMVGERVTQLTNGLQKPTSRNETNNYDWVIW